MRTERLAEDDNPDQYGSDGADACPDGISEPLCLVDPCAEADAVLSAEVEADDLPSLPVMARMNIRPKTRTRRST